MVSLFLITGSFYICLQHPVSGETTESQVYKSSIGLSVLKGPLLFKRAMSGVSILLF